MAVLHSYLNVPPPKKDNVYILGITGLPPQCSKRLGWQIVKDLVRVVLEHHGLIDRYSGTKPGMVHMSTTSVEVSDLDKDGSGMEHKDKGPPGPASAKVTKQVITAHVSMKSPAAAWHTCNTIAGNRLWGYPLTAAVFPRTTGDEKVAGHGHEGSSECEFAPLKAGKALQWQKPHELGDRFRITVPWGCRTWYHRPNGKATKGGTDTTKSQNRLVQEAPYIPTVYMQAARMKRSGSDISSCSTLVDGTPPPAQQQVDERFYPVGGGGQYLSLGWAMDWYGRWIPAYQSAWGQTYGLPPFCAGKLEGMVKETRSPTLEDIIARDQVAF
ncbi:MAG: hypothetical protein Q9173_006800 [Seirophora scorigena]